MSVIREINQGLAASGAIYVATSYQSQSHEMSLTDGTIYGQASTIVTLGLPSLAWAKSELLGHGDHLIQIAVSATAINEDFRGANVSGAAVLCGSWHKSIASRELNSAEEYDKAMSALLLLIEAANLKATFSVIRSGSGGDPYLEVAGSAESTAWRAERWTAENDGTTVWAIGLGGVPGVGLFRIELSVAHAQEMDVLNWRWAAALRGVAHVIESLGV